MKEKVVVYIHHSAVLLPILLTLMRRFTTNVSAVDKLLTSLWLAWARTFTQVDAYSLLSISDNC